ncbi:MAG: retropepsin-like domain-containing protein [Bacteroidales bacterium]|nr:retropepsin-like domain-containing protein [Bacteroidales bacterium]
MGVIINRIKLVGSKGTKKIDGLFDSGASFSFINYELAKKLDIILDLSEPIEFETAEEGRKITVSKRILLDFYIEDIRLSDEFLIAEDLSEEVIIGAATMQKWRLKLNFDQDRVIVDQRVTRPMLK